VSTLVVMLRHVTCIDIRSISNLQRMFASAGSVLLTHVHPARVVPRAQPTTQHFQLQACSAKHILRLYCADTGADFMNWNVANQVDRERSTTITISSQRSTNSEGGRAGLSSHGTHVFGTVRRQPAPRCIVCSACLLLTNTAGHGVCCCVV
jgi:hypothetical protein